MNSEFLIIGGGVIGLAIAREMHKKGVRRITVVDRGTLGAEASWAAAGMLSPNIETDTTPDFHRFGIHSLELYPEFAEELLAETGVDIELDRTGTLCVAFDENEEAGLLGTFERQKKRGVAVEQLTGDEVREREPSVSAAVCGALFYPNDWQVENRKLVSALRQYAETNGIDIVQNTHVSELIADGRRITGARTSDGELLAHVTILATGAWTSLIKIGDNELSIDVRPIRGQMISIEPGTRELHAVVYSPRGYLVPRANGRILVGATVEDVGFDKNTTVEGVEALKIAAVEILPRLHDRQIVDRWAGLRPFAADGLPVIGALPGYDSILIATAHYRNGILLAPGTARIIADKIVDHVDSEYFRAFSSDRFVSTVRLGSLN